MKIKKVHSIKQFQGYDRTVARCHLDNWGVVYVDEHDQPIDVEEMQDILSQNNEEETNRGL